MFVVFAGFVAFAALLALDLATAPRQARKAIASLHARRFAAQAVPEVHARAVRMSAEVAYTLRPHRLDSASLAFRPRVAGGFCCGSTRAPFWSSPGRRA